MLSTLAELYEDTCMFLGLCAYGAKWKTAHSIYFTIFLPLRKEFVTDAQKVKGLFAFLNVGQGKVRLSSL